MPAATAVAVLAAEVDKIYFPTVAVDAAAAAAAVVAAVAYCS